MTIILFKIYISWSFFTKRSAISWGNIRIKCL